MPIAVFEHKKIYYRFEGERGPFLVLGNPELHSIETWERLGYLEPLKEHFRIILIDRLGQGRSDIPEEAEYYTVEHQAKQILEVVNCLNIASFHYVGFDMGGQIGYQLAKQSPERLRSLSIAGAHPYSISTEVEAIHQSIQLIKDNGVEAYIQQFEEQGSLSDVQKQAWMALEPHAFIHFMEQSLNWEGISESLQKLRTPALLLTCTNEDKFLSIREAGRSVSSARYLILPELTYFDGMLTQDIMVPPILEFINRLRG